MKAEFEVRSMTVSADGTKQFRIQPVGEPGFRVLELLDPEDEGALGDLVVEFDAEKFLPRPGKIVTLKLTKQVPRGGGD